MRLAKLLILSTCLTGLSTMVQAQNCAVRPDCETLGYDRTEAECANQLMLRCPFDSSAVFCGGDLCPNAVTCTSPATCAETCTEDSNVCVRCQMPDRGEFFDGHGNTAAIIAQIRVGGLAATACNQFYPAEEGISSTDATFGAGNWHLPAMGELMKMYGISSGSAVISDTGTHGVDASKGKTLVNAGLTAAGGTALNTSYNYLSSSEFNNYFVWNLSMSDGYRGNDSKDYRGSVRCFQLLENCFNPSTPVTSAPQIGDIMFSDKTWSSSTVSGKTPVGVVVDVYGYDVTIVNLKDLTFSSYSSSRNFDASSPYTGSYDYTYWAISSYYSTDITALTNYNSSSVFLPAVQGYDYW